MLGVLYCILHCCRVLLIHLGYGGAPLGGSLSFLSMQQAYMATSQIVQQIM